MTFYNSMLRLAFLDSPPKKVGLEVQVKKQFKEAPLTTLLSVVGMDRTGRTIAKMPSILSSDEKEQKAALEAEMFGIAQFHHQTIAMGIVEPARRRILEERPPPDRISFTRY